MTDMTLIIAVLALQTIFCIIIGLTMRALTKEIAGYRQIQAEAALAYIRMTKENQQLNSRVNEMLVRTFGAEREPVE